MNFHAFSKNRSSVSELAEEAWVLRKQQEQLHNSSFQDGIRFLEFDKSVKITWVQTLHGSIQCSGFATLVLVEDICRMFN